MGGQNDQSIEHDPLTGACAEAGASLPPPIGPTTRPGRRSMPLLPQKQHQRYSRPMPTKTIKVNVPNETWRRLRQTLLAKDKTITSFVTEMIMEAGSPDLGTMMIMEFENELRTPLPTEVAKTRKRQGEMIKGFVPYLL